MHTAKRNCTVDMVLWDDSYTKILTVEYACLVSTTDRYKVQPWNTPTIEYATRAGKIKNGNTAVLMTKGTMSLCIIILRF